GARGRAPAVSPGIQGALPKHRFDVGAGDEAFGVELGREMPADRAAIETVLRRVSATSALVDPLLATEITLPPDGFWERREVARLESLLPRRGTDLLAPLPVPHPIRAVVGAPAGLARPRPPLPPRPPRPPPPPP